MQNRSVDRIESRWFIVAIFPAVVHQHISPRHNHKGDQNGANVPSTLQMIMVLYHEAY